MNDTAQSRYVKDCLRYMRQQKGLALFWLWLERWISVDGWVYDKERGAFCLSENASARFLFGAPKPGFGAAGKPVFLGVQSEEEAWLSRMNPSKVIFDNTAGEDQRLLWLVFSGMTSPDRAWADLPPTVLGIRVYGEQLLGWQGRELDVRAIWWNDEVTPPLPVVQASALISLPVQHSGLLAAWNPNEIFVKTLRQRAIERAEAELEQRGLDQDPGFKGAPPVLDDSQKKLIDPFADKPVELIETNYHGLFGQFIDGVEVGPRRRKSG